MIAEAFAEDDGECSVEEYRHGIVTEVNCCKQIISGQPQVVKEMQS